MPLFMDFHNFEGGITLNEVVSAHMADLKVQDKYGVRYIKFYVNQDSGNVFCLMEGPDEETCEAVHKEAHGNIACNIIKVEPGDFETVMGGGKVNNSDVAQLKDGEIDSGIRFFLSYRPDSSLMWNQNVKGIDIDQIFQKYEGRKLEREGEGIQAIFTSCLNSLKCAQEIESKLKKSKNNKFRIGISAGNPVDKDRSNFFDSAIRLSIQLSEIAKENQILITAEVKNTCDKQNLLPELNKNSSIKSLTLAEQSFLNQLMETIELELDDKDLSVDKLGKEMGESRPQLYRKIIKITGKAPNDFIREVRLKTSVQLLKKGFGNVSQIAFETGFNNPSYFAKCFKEYYGVLPSEYSKQLHAF